jgi:hypothetical protein
MAIAAVPASDGISAFAGGRVKSPDGQWAVWAAAADADLGDPAVARLDGPGVRERALMSFERRVEVVWPRAAGRVVLVQRTIHRDSLHVFSLGASETGEDRVQRDIERGLAMRVPKLGEVINRRTAFGQARGGDCVLVEESGLPPGRSEGSLVVRRAAFQLDLRGKRAVAIRSCPGATLPA